MLPEGWQFDETLPRTDRGKVDWQALQRVVAGRAS
jgi:hypothetical protein